MIEIVEPSKKIFDLYGFFEKSIKEVLPNSNVRLIGSFAIPMCGKKEIDILVESEFVEESQKILSGIGFSAGPIVDGEAFLRKNKEGFVCEVHILPFGHKKIRKVYDFVIKTLKEDEKLRKDFELVKKSFNGKSEEEYKLAKANFLKERIFG